jgi:hypothetical protein
MLGGLLNCGKKADPRPPDVPPPSAISDLKATLIESGVSLRWSIPQTKGVIQKFKIQRSELDKDKYSCLDCPREFTLIADIVMNDPALRKEEGNIVGYQDLQVRSGYIYMYRIIACDSSGNCSEASNIEEIKFSDEFPKGRKGASNRKK